MIDMHTHSLYSDGTNTVSELIELLKEYELYSITDHDNISSAIYIQNNGLNKPNYITGVELSTADMNDSIHILFYNFNPDNKELYDIVDWINIARRKRLHERLDILKNDFNIVLSDSEIKWLESLENPTRPNIASILINDGYASSISEAFDKYLYHKLETRKPNSIDVIKRLKNIFGVIVLAHPLGGINEKRIDRLKLEDRIKRFKEVGLDGIECMYSLYTKEESSYLINLAKTNDLYISGGSDFHGKNKNVKIGELSSDDNDNYKYINIKNAFSK